MKILCDVVEFILLISKNQQIPPGRDRHSHGKDRFCGIRSIVADSPAGNIYRRSGRIMKFNPITEFEIGNLGNSGSS